MERKTDVVSYVDVETTTTPDIALAPFVEESISRGATSANSYLTSVQFGFEPWRGGKRLAVDDFTHSPTGERPSRTTPITPTAGREQAAVDDQAQDDDGDADADADADADEQDRTADRDDTGDSDSDRPAAATTTGARALVGAGSNRCADVAGRSTTPGAPVQLWTCQSENTAQQWTPGEGDAVVNTGSGLCLDVATGATTNGAPIQQWTCRDGAPGQQWKAGDGDTLVNTASGRCLDATDQAAAGGTRLVLWDCQPGAADQAWVVR